MLHRNLPFLTLLCVLLAAAPAFGQKKGYNIIITPGAGLDGKYYLAGFYGNETYILDSAQTKNGQLAFKGKQILPDGYYVIADANRNEVCELVVEQARKFEISALSGPHIAATTSTENKLFADYLAMAGDREEYVRAVASASPNALTSQFMLLTEFRADSLLNPDCEGLLHHPLYEQLVWPALENADAPAMEAFFHRHNVNRPVGRYYLGRKLLQLWQSGSDDALLVHLYDKYYSPALALFDEQHDRLIKRHTDRARRVIAGARIPPLEAANESGKMESTKSIQRAYTLLWFWDPDCDDCMVETPQLHDFYLENADRYDFEVFAVSITEDTDRWKRAVGEMQLSWINTCYAIAPPNYDFIDYFSIITTPGAFLINQNHEIIMHSFSLEELQLFFEKSHKNSEE